MRRVRLTCLALLLLGVAALGGASAANAALNLETTGAGLLTRESEIWGSSANLTLVTDEGIVRCPSIAFDGYLYRYRSGEALILGQYGGAYRLPQYCESSLDPGPGWEIPPDGFIPTSFDSNNNWTIELSTDGSASIRDYGNGEGEYGPNKLFFTFGSCMYESRTPNMNGTFTIGGPVELSFTEDKFVRDGTWARWADSICPRVADVSATFILHHEGLQEDELVTSSL